MFDVPRLNRRRFLAATLAGAAGLAAGGYGIAHRSGGLWLSASDSPDGRHFLSAVDSHGNLRFRLAVPERAHDVCCSPDGRRALFFARRPGRESYVVNLADGAMETIITSEPGYHFYGHGVFSRDGRHLFTTENDFRRQRGVIGVYDSADFRRIGEWDLNGIGPHQVALLSDDRTLVVGLGGILTHPDAGREKLNLDIMRPALVYLDSRSGTLLERLPPPHHKLSIRHLDVAPDDRVIASAQFQGDSGGHWPLVFSHRGEDSLQPMQLERPGWAAMNDYIASVATSDDNHTALTTTPRGNLVTLWDLSTAKALFHLPVRDVAGAAFDSTRQHYLVSNGAGQMLGVPASVPDDSQPKPQPYCFHPDCRWDNHLHIV